jgi:putative membrane protein
MNRLNHSKTMQHLNRAIIASVAVLGALSCLAAQTGKADHKESAFIKDAAQGGQAEVQMGQMAAQKAQNDQVKQFAQHLQQDHSQANQELTQIAQKLGVNVPSQPDRKETRTSEKLQDMTGANFDKAFIEHAIKDHQKDITKYEKALQDVQDPGLKAFIQKSLPTLHKHLQMARTTGTAVGVDEKTLTAADRFLSEHSAGSLRNQGVGTTGSSTESGSSGTKGQSDHDTSGHNSTAPDQNQSGSSSGKSDKTDK